MPINASPEYIAAQRKYEAAITTQEKIVAMQEMMSTAPGHKGAENLHKELARRMIKLKDTLEKEKSKKGGRKSIAVKKEGFQIVILGFPNAGKSTLLKALTGSDVKIAAYPCTTVEPEIGMLDYEGAQLQLVEVPALIEGAAEKQGELMSIAHASDGIMLIYEGDYQKQTLLNELYKFGIKKTTMFIEKGKMPTKAQIFNFFDLIRIYTKEPGEDYSKEKPLILKRGTTVIEAAARVHKDFLKKFCFVRVWGSSRFSGQRVEQDYVLKDKDVIEFHMER